MHAPASLFAHKQNQIVTVSTRWRTVLESMTYAHSFVFRLLCVNSLQVRDALASKVSRERIGAELEGMFTGALQDLHLHFYLDPILVGHSFSAPSTRIRALERG